MYAKVLSTHKDTEMVLCRYRLVAIDHDLFSFVDTRLDHWPLVLVTNPKDSRFSVPGREPLGRILHSTHVRSLTINTLVVDSIQS